MVKSVLPGASGSVVGLLLVVPNLAGLIAMIIVSRHSDRTLERRRHMAAAGALAGIGLLLLDASPSPFLSVVLFSVVAIGSYSFLPIFFSAPGEFLSGFPAAAGIALVTSMTNLGGFVGPYVVGSFRGRTGSLSAGLAVAGLSFLVSATLALLLPGKAQAGRNPSAISNAGGAGLNAVFIGGASRDCSPRCCQSLSRKGRNHEIRPNACSDRAGA
jgi:ACS family tartrate transporter-like MFS transporter